MHIAHLLQERKVDHAALVLFVVRHQFIKPIVVFAVERKGRIVLFDVIDHLAHLLHREAADHVREIQLADDARRHGVAVQDGALLLEGEALVGMADGMTKVERLADALLLGILLDDALLDSHRLLHESVQVGIVHRVDVVEHHRGVVLHIADQAMLDHLGIAREDVVAVERAQELAVDEDTERGIERTDLVLQPVEVDARLAANRRVDRGHQRRGDVDGADATLEGSPREASHVGHHAATQVDQQRMARSPLVGEPFPDLGQMLQALVGIARRRAEDRRPLQRLDTLKQRQTERTRMLIG